MSKTKAIERLLCMRCHEHWKEDVTRDSRSGHLGEYRQSMRYIFAMRRVKSARGRVNLMSAQRRLLLSENAPSVIKCNISFKQNMSCKRFAGEAISRGKPGKALFPAFSPACLRRVI